MFEVVPEQEPMERIIVLESVCVWTCTATDEGHRPTCINWDPVPGFLHTVPREEMLGIQSFVANVFPQQYWLLIACHSLGPCSKTDSFLNHRIPYAEVWKAI